MSDEGWVCCSNITSSCGMYQCLMKDEFATVTLHSVIWHVPVSDEGWICYSNITSSCGMYQCLMRDEFATVTLHLSYGMCQCMIKDEPAKYCNITSCHMACVSVQLRMSLQHWHNILSHGSCTQAHTAVTVEGRGWGGGGGEDWAVFSLCWFLICITIWAV